MTNVKFLQKENDFWLNGCSIYYVQTNETPGECSHENMMSSHVKR